MFNQGYRSGAIMKGKGKVQRSFSIKVQDSIIKCWDADERGGGTKKGSITVYPGGREYKDLNLPELIIKRQL